MSYPSLPSGSDQLQFKPQAVFSQTAFNEAGKLSRINGLLQPSGSGLTPLATGESIPLVFCKRTADLTGGVFLSPRAAKLRFVEQGGATGDDAFFTDTQVLLPMDGTNGSTVVNDLSVYGRTITLYGSGQLSTADKKFGTASFLAAATDGADRFSVPSNALVLTGRWTIELFVKVTSGHNSIQYIFYRRDSSLNHFHLRYDNTTGRLELIRDGSSNILPSNNSFSLNTWYHVAVVNDGVNVKLYQDGVELGSVDAYTGGDGSDWGDMYFGGRNVASGSTGLGGYIDEVRITENVARYLGNFTPPTSAFPTEGVGGGGLPGIDRNYWLVPTSGQLDNPSLTLFYGDKILGSGTLYYNTACPFTPVTTVTNETYVETFPTSVGDTNGTFANLSCIDYSYSDNTATLTQAHVYTDKGVKVTLLSSTGTGASNLFSDLMNYLLQEAARVPADLIDATGLGTVGLFLQNYNLFFDGAIQASTNLREFLENGSLYFLVYVTQNQGKWGLTPRLPVNGSNQLDNTAITPSKTFTGTDIIADTFERLERNVSETLPFTAVMSYRNEPGNAPSEVKSVEVAYTGEAGNGPFERYDLTDFCTRSDHAELIGKYIIAMRRWSTHTVRFSSTQESSDLNVGDIFRVDFDVESTLGGTDQYDETYQVISIEESQQGLVVIEGQHFPLMPDGSSRIVDQITNNFVRPVQPLIKQFTVAVDDSTPANGQTVTFTPTIDSDLTDLSYQWTTPTGSTPGQSVTTEILSFTYNSSTDEGQYTLTVSSPSALDSPQSASDSIGTGIGNVQVVPSTQNYAETQVITLTASYDGNATDVTWSWTGPSGTNAPVTTETSNILTWTAGGSEDAGGYTVTATSVTSFDSPQQAQSTLTYDPYIVATGGTVTTDGDYRIHTFTENDELVVTYAPPAGRLEYLICGSGGGASSSTGRGGGGGGGVLTGNTTPAAQTYLVTVGVARGYGVAATASNHSSAFGFTALAGGHGGYFTNQSLMDGGCGGGEGPDIPHIGTGSQGGDGGAGQDNSSGTAGGGGGGASGADGSSGLATSGTSYGGDGGEGVTSSISGTSYVYGSGGGGSLIGTYPVVGQVSDGGTGAGQGGFISTSSGGGFISNYGTAATNYGAGQSAYNGTTSDGMPGIVIMRYQYQGVVVPVIGNLTLNANNTDFQTGSTVTLTASFDGNINDPVYAWSGPSGTTAPVSTETSNVLTWTAAGSQDSGDYTVTVTSATASDSPQQATVTLTYNIYISATGGTITTDGDFKIHTFTSSDTFTISWNPNSTSLEYLICAAGGAGWPLGTGGGGGGGGVLTGTTTKSVGSYPLTVGSGGSGSGGDSSIFNLTAEGGGEGVGYDGGCGGGGYGVSTYSTGGNGSQGGDGGDSRVYTTGSGAGGGGGGASGANGGNATGSTSTFSNTSGGNGGAGLQSSITGTATYYGSGGGGAAESNYPYTASRGTSSTGGGQGGHRYYDGSNYVEQSVAPPTVYGGGGGAGWSSSASYGSSADRYGNDGVVIIRYRYQ